MFLSTVLSDFNYELATALVSTFSDVVKPYQTKFGELVFRGPIPLPNDPNHIGTHVMISLENDVLAALDMEEPTRRKILESNLIGMLVSNVQIQYDPNNIGTYALEIKGSIEMLHD